MTVALLRTTGLSRRYGTTTVLDQVDFEVKAGEIHGLLGANGAGKSTLCRIIAGLVTPTAGAMWIRGSEFRPAGKQDAEARGIQIVQQELNLIGTLSVAENLQLSHLPHRAGFIRRAELHRFARVILDRYGLPDVTPQTVVSELGIGRQQMVEIASALARDCQLLILDEPTAALSGSEASRLFTWLRELRGNGVGIIYISHRLDEVRQLCDRFTVLQDGRNTGTRLSRDVTTDEMVGMMSGGLYRPTDSDSHCTHRASRTAMRVNNICRGPVRNVSFQLFQGERLGITGLVGSGRTELLRILFGADVAVAGHVLIGDNPRLRRFRSPSEAVAAGLAMITEDRRRDGLLLPQSIRANTTLRAVRRQFSRLGVIQQQRERQQTEKQRRSLHIQCQSIEQPVQTLSGGNQQKVAVAKWLVHDASIFLFDEPTRGIDIAARQQIYRLFDSLAARGKGLIIVSSDLDELMANCDRIGVLSAGRWVATFNRGDWTEDKLLQAAFSGYRDKTTGAAEHRPLSE